MDGVAVAGAPRVLGDVVGTQRDLGAEAIVRADRHHAGSRPISSNSRRTRVKAPASSLSESPSSSAVRSRIHSLSLRTIAASRSPASATSRMASALVRSEEHTSELQSQSNLVCRLLLEKKKKKTN